MIHHLKKWIATLALAAVVAVPSVSYATNAISVIGVGAKSKGMGGVGVALSQDAFAGAMNPAGIAYQCNRFDVGFGWVWQDGCVIQRSTETSNPAFKVGSDEGYWLPEAAVAWEFCPCQVLGVAVYTAAAGHTKYVKEPPLFGGPGDSEFFYYNLFVTPSWGWRINSCHSVGAALNISFSWLDVKGFSLTSTETLHPNDVTNNGENSSEGVSFAIGWVGQFCDVFRVGATFQSTTWSNRYKKYQGTIVDEGRMNLPPEVGVGIAWTCMPCVTLSADLIYRFWQESAQFDNASRDPGLQQNFQSFGASFGPGFGWENQMIAKVGAAWRVWPCLTLRVGYNYAEVPLAPSETVLNAFFLPCQEHHFTLGATYCWCGWEGTFFYYHAFEKTVKGFDSTGIENVTVEWDIRNQQNVAGISLGRWF